jgi:RNA polymerase sigma-70 factor (ECF subfamily)
MPIVENPRAGRDVDAAMRALYAEHARVLRAYCQRFTGDDGLAEEIVQETFVRAWRNLDRLQADPRPTRSWLLHVARNLLTDAARAARARPRLLPELPEPGSAPPGVATAAAEPDRFADRAELADALRQLSPAHREVVLAAFYLDEPLTATARRLGVPPGTVRSRLHYALSRLRGLLTSDLRIAA